MAGEPLPPSGLTATAVSSSQIDAAWVDNAADVAGTNEVQTVTLDATPEAGSMTLTYDAETTAAIAYDADGAAITAALEDTAAFETGDISASRSGNVITLTYQGGLAAMSLPEITANSSLLQDASTIDVTVTQSGIADVAATPSISTTTAAVAPVASTPSINTTTTNVEPVTGVAEVEVLSLGGATTGTFYISSADSASSYELDVATIDAAAIESAVETMGGAGVSVADNMDGSYTITWDGDPGLMPLPLQVTSNSTDGSPSVSQSSDYVLAVTGVHQVDTITFDAAPVAGAMEVSSSTLAYDDDASTLSLGGATGSGTPASGTITITWGDYTSHSPTSVAAGTLLSVTGVHQVDTITFSATPVAGSMTINSNALAYDSDASGLGGMGAGVAASGTPASGTITITWEDYDDHTPLTIDGGSLLSVVGRPHSHTITLSDAPTEGTLKTSKSGSDSDTFSANASAASVEAAIEAISGGYPCTVTGTDGGPWTITSDDNIAAPTWAAEEVDPLRKSVGITIDTTTEGSPQQWDDLGSEVHRSTDGVSYSLLVDLGANMESWPDATCSASTEYWYKVRAYNEGGYSAFSNADSDTTFAAEEQGGEQSVIINAILPAARSAAASPFNWGI